jgi:hypothetical protein
MRRTPAWGTGLSFSTIEERQRQTVSCGEEFAYRMWYIDGRRPRDLVQSRSESDRKRLLPPAVVQATAIMGAQAGAL